MSFQFFILILHRFSNTPDMPKDNISSQEYDKLLNSILRLVMKRGLKATTMDIVAAEFSISKRTLYEIFENKNQMLIEVIRLIFSISENESEKIFSSAPDMMVAFIRTFRYHISRIESFSVEFFLDMDSYYKELREFYEEKNQIRSRRMHHIFEIGKEQGVFSKNVNYLLAYKMFTIQLESLKRMEELFPKDITIREAYEHITFSFLRSIASEKGLKILEEFEADRSKL